MKFRYYEEKNNKSTVDFDVNLRISVQGVKSLGGHFACLSRGVEFYEVKKSFFVIIFQ